MPDTISLTEPQALYADANCTAVDTIMPVIAELGYHGKLGSPNQTIVALLTTAAMLNETIKAPASRELMHELLDMSINLGPTALKTYLEEFVDDETYDVEGN